MLLRITQVLSLSLMLTACQLVKPLSINEQPQTALIDPSQLELQPLAADTDFADSFQCLISPDKPEKSEPYWIAPKNIWQRIPLGYAIDHNHNKRIQAEFNWYARHPSYMQRVSKRAERYVYHIVEELEKRQMPTELALLPIVESAFDPFAYSHGRASGMWQFIPGTARMFKLKNNWWYDGRRDTIASTNAALTYLQRLSNAYDGDWQLALAAYNSGQGTVNKAIRRNKAKGKPTDYWSLDLPRETKSYVPKLLALAELIANPLRYGIALHPVANAPYFEAVDTHSQIDLAQAAEMAGVDIEEIYKLNPGFNRWATDPDGPHSLLVPIDQAAQFSQKVSELSRMDRLNWQRYTVQNGDSLLLLAKKFNTDVSTIRDVNKIKGNMIRAGQKLMIPVAYKAKHQYAYSAESRSNKIKRSRNGGKGTSQIYHEVKPGESLWTIARKYQVSTRKIAHWNGFAPKDYIRPGQELSIWIDNKQAETVSTTQLPSTKQRSNIKKLGYTVRSGDSLARIANKFSLKISDIVKWNSVNPKKYLQPGQRLTLYVDVMNRH